MKGRTKFSILAYADSHHFEETDACYGLRCPSIPLIETLSSHFALHSTVVACHEHEAVKQIDPHQCSHEENQLAT
ncbi:hypothetical protein Leryth_008277 [Lithospermum erythrorhizon]|nr:hypothetical protein Leryth_008277 [Lithospermum erythrorhizon]